MYRNRPKTTTESSTCSCNENMTGATMQRVFIKHAYDNKTRYTDIVMYANLFFFLLRGCGAGRALFLGLRGRRCEILIFPSSLFINERQCTSNKPRVKCFRNQQLQLMGFNHFPLTSDRPAPFYFSWDV